uniref:GATA-type domain-containing protein n=1 Tax=Kalanchoe fedtschenkoi TaxID=63787 RepID=A0A7N0T854_KALFE
MMHNNMSSYYSQSNGNQQSCYDYDYYCAADPYGYSGFNAATSSSTSSNVDCTLSLGTPSTRSDAGGEQTKKQSGRRSGNRVSNFCWDLLQQTTLSSSKHSAAGTNSYSKGGRASGGGGGGDPLVARRCANCDTTSTPLWRNGPKGPKSLCNACGIRYKKEERRASAAASATSHGSGASAMESQYASSEHYYSNQSYTHHQTQRMNCLFPAAANEYRYTDADDGGSYEHSGNGGVSFLPWMLNVADRPSLVHDFTR